MNPTEKVIPCSSLAIYGEGGYWLTNKNLNFFANEYLPNSEEEKEKIIKDPFFNVSEFTNYGRWPPTFIATGNSDPLLNGTLELVNKMKISGVDVNYIELAGILHDFMLFPGFYIQEVSTVLLSLVPFIKNIIDPEISRECSY